MRPEILVYLRDYFRKVYPPLFDGLGGFKSAYLTDFPDGKASYSIRDAFNAALAAGAEPPAGLDAEDVIARCRLLRNLPRAQARAMVGAAYRTLSPIVAHRPWRAIIGQTVDEYVTHLLALLAKRRGIPYFGLTGSYFPGYSQVTLGIHGEAAQGRSAGDEEANKALQNVSGDNFRQDYTTITHYSPVVHARKVVRYWTKTAAFAVLRRIRQAPWHYHYRMQPFIAQPQYLSAYPTADCFTPDWQRALQHAPRPLVYLPLSLTPEASTDYWITDRAFIDYEKAVLELCASLSQSFTVLVKEHFHMSGVREKAFYQRLLRMPRVVNVPPGVNSNMLVSKFVDKVLVGAGSVGIEATLRGCQVFSYCDTSYWYRPSNAIHLDPRRLASWRETIQSERSSSSPPLTFVRRCLDTMLPFDYLAPPYLNMHRSGALDRFLSTALGNFYATPPSSKVARIP